MTEAKPGTASKGLAAVLALAVPLVAYFEGYIPHTYADPIGIPTACYGHTGPEVTPGRKFSEEECKDLLAGDLRKANDAVRRCIRVPLKPHEEAALTSATFNAGPRIVCQSTLGRLANAGEPATRWCPELRKWVYAGGVKLRGLVRRREAETRMCLGVLG